jgi:endonuclease-3
MPQRRAIKRNTCLSKAQAREVFRILHERWPQAHCELHHHSPFQLLIAVVLSAQATDVSVNKSFGAFCDLHPHFGPADLVAMGQEGFLQVIRTVGLAPTKARNCVRLAAALIAHHGGTVPSKREELEALPGVGRKTANVVLNVLFGQPTMAVDTHVARLAVRIGLVPETQDRTRIEEALLRLVPPEFAHNAHHTMIFHGRYHCTARKADCTQCPLQDVCLKKGQRPLKH